MRITMKHCSASRYKPASKSKKDKEETTAIFTPPNSDADIDATFQRKEAQSGIEIKHMKEEESKVERGESSKKPIRDSRGETTEEENQKEKQEENKTKTTIYTDWITPTM